jgi:lipoyl(octanoyl) transferase
LSSTTVRISRPGLIDYGQAWSWQRDRAAELRDGRGAEWLALLQHPPVYTLGRRARPEHLLAGRADLARRGAGVVEVDRGGDVTFHGPGQLVGYPILDLRARRLLPADYVRDLEQTLIEALAVFGISGERVHGRPGVWAGGGKIAAIGVRVQGGATTHGFALNVSTDLSWFDAIVPCGLADATVTSMASILGASPDFEAVEEAVADAFGRVFDAELAPSLGPAAFPPEAASFAEVSGYGR